MITLITFIASLGFVGKFMGGMLAIKVFIAKVWSFLLAIFLKVGGTVVYFFSDYLWSSWLAPIIEVLVFSWLLSWIEKIPFLSTVFKKVYAFFIYTFGWVQGYLDKIFHLPMKRILRWFVKKIQKKIYQFMGDKPLSMWKLLEQKRIFQPNSYRKIKIKREKRSEEKKQSSYVSSYRRLKNRRKDKKEP
jgi:hypothetical protein